jgi:hypothetical protein
MTNTPFELVGKTKFWDHKEGDQYLVTGTNTNGKRIRLCYTNWVAARSIHLWSGNRWLVRNGKRYLIHKV